jgi:hypothetical protein
MPQASGLAREVGRLWASDVYHERILRTTCDVVPTVEFEPKDLDVRDITWDGNNVWAIGLSGRIVSYTIDGYPVQVIDGLLQHGWGLTWADGLLWASEPGLSMLYRITLHPGSAYLFYREHDLIDSLANGNGILDPGETAQLSVRITNCGGGPADSLQGFLMEDDPFLVISVPQCTYGTIPIGGSASNEGEPFTIHAAHATPEGYHATLKLVLTSDGFADTLDFELRVGLPQGDYLIWDGDPNRSSGPVVKQLLDSLQYEGEYTHDLREYLPVLDRFQSIWVFCGQYPMREVISRNCAEADSLESYLRRHNGCMYMEGAEVFYYDPLLAMGFDFAPLFGILGISDGGCDLDTIHGKQGNFAGEMSFAYEGENFWIDRLAVRPYSSACSLFVNSDPAYCCGISCEVPTRRTVGVSFEISGLVDSDSCSKYALVDSIMRFFGIAAGAYEKEEVAAINLPYLHCMPNPVRDHCVIHYGLAVKCMIKMVLYDASGRVISVLAVGEEEGERTRLLDLSGLASGVYFVKLSIGDHSYTQKLTVVR